MITVATILCDRKAYSQLLAVQAIAKMRGEFKLYLNIETKGNIELYRPLLNYIEQSGLLYDFDIWSWTSSWKQGPVYDQDQGRLDGIVHARNFARNYALQNNSTHLMFVDSDVVPRPDALERLLSLKHPFVGGLVPGRGCHSHVHYVFGKQKPVPGKPGVISCTHGTMGLSLIERELFTTLAFRYGRSRTNPKVGLSEDPAYSEDAKLNGFGDFWLDTQTIADHRDDPKNPLIPEHTARDGVIPL